MSPSVITVPMLIAAAHVSFSNGERKFTCAESIRLQIEESFSEIRNQLSPNPVLVGSAKQASLSLHSGKRTPPPTPARLVGFAI